MNKILLIFLLFCSNQIFGQEDNVTLKNKIESYKYLDTINTYSKNYPTKLIEGSGTIKNNKKKIIGSIGFETEISRNTEQKFVRLYDSQTFFYKKTRKGPAKNVNYQTTIYFDKNQKPDIAKVVTEELIDNKTVKKETEFLNIKTIDFNRVNLNFKELRIRRLLFELQN